MEWDSRLVGMTTVMNAATQVPMDISYLDQADLMVLNLAIAHFGEQKLLAPLKRLTQYVFKCRNPNDHTYGMVLCGFAAAGRLDLASDLWRRWVRNKIDLGPVACSAMIKACAMHKDADLALQVFEQMQRNSMRIDRLTSNCLIRLCLSVTWVDEAFGVYKLMRMHTDEQQTPDVYTYSIMISFAARTASTELLYSLYENMLADEVKPDARIYCKLISTLSRLGDAERCQAYYDEMLSFEVQPNAFVVNALLSAHARRGDWPAVQRAAAGARRAGIAPDRYTYSILLTAATRSARGLDVVEGLDREATAAGLLTQPQVGATLMTAYRALLSEGVDDKTRTRVVMRCCQVFAALRKAGTANSHVMYAMATLMAHAGEVSAARRLVCELEALRLQGGSWRALAPTLLYQAVARGLMEAGLTDEAAEFTRKAMLQQQRDQPNRWPHGDWDG